MLFIIGLVDRNKACSVIHTGPFIILYIDVLPFLGVGVGGFQLLPLMLRSLHGHIRSERCSVFAEIWALLCPVLQSNDQEEAVRWGGQPAAGSGQRAGALPQIHGHSSDQAAFWEVIQTHRHLYIALRVWRSGSPLTCSSTQHQRSRNAAGWMVNRVHCCSLFPQSCDWLDSH